MSSNPVLTHPSRGKTSEGWVFAKEIIVPEKQKQGYSEGTAVGPVKMEELCLPAPPNPCLVGPCLPHPLWEQGGGGPRACGVAGLSEWLSVHSGSLTLWHGGEQALGLWTGH